MKTFLTLSLLFFFAQTNALAGFIPGLKGPYIDMIDGKIQVSVAFTKLELPGYVGVYIPKLPNSSAVIEPNSMDGGTLLTVKLSPDDIKIIKGITTDKGYLLPDGRPIPGIPGGKIKNGLRLDLKPAQHSLSFYYHEKLFGFYIPLNLNYNFPVNQAAIELRWKDKSVGSLHLVGPEAGKKAALLVFIRLKEIEENPEIMKELTKTARLN